MIYRPNNRQHGVAAPENTLTQPAPSAPEAQAADEVAELKATLERMRVQLEEAKSAAASATANAPPPPAALVGTPDGGIVAVVPVTADRSATPIALPTQDEIFSNMQAIMSQHIKDQEELGRAIDEGKKAQARDIQHRLRMKRDNRMHVSQINLAATEPDHDPLPPPDYTAPPMSDDAPKL